MNIPKNNIYGTIILMTLNLGILERYSCL